MEETQSIYGVNHSGFVHESKQPEQMNETDDKTYSLARKIFEGLALILANIFTVGLINIFPTVRAEYEPVFGISWKKLFGSEDLEQVPNSLAEDQSMETTEAEEDSEHEEIQPLIDLSAILPPELTNLANIKVVIPEVIQQSLATLFGIEDIVNKLPICQKIGDSTFSAADMPSPVMKVCAANHTPAIIFKLKVADPQEYLVNFEKFTNEDSLRSRAEKIQTTNLETKEYSIDQLIIILKEAQLNVIKEQIHLFSLIPYDNQEPLCWISRVAGDNYREPAFFTKKGFLDEPNFTDKNTGELVPSAKSQMLEFQKLFNGDGIATDPNGNKWKLDP